MNKYHQEFLHRVDKLIYNNRELIGSFDSRDTVKDTERGAALIAAINNLEKIATDIIHWEEVE